MPAARAPSPRGGRPPPASAGRSVACGPYNRFVTSAEIKARAAELGFDLCGIAPVGPFEELGFFRTWLDRGYAGEMGYLARSAERRADVRAVMPSARSVVCLGTVYNTDRPYSTEVVNGGA